MSLPSHWRLGSVGELIAGIDSGKNLRCEERPPTLNEVGIVKISAVTWGTFDPSKSKTVVSDTQLPDSTRIRAGDLLMSRANTLELVGATVLVEKAPTNLHLSDKVLRLRVKPGWGKWLNIFLNSVDGRSEIESRAIGNQLSMRNIGQDAIRNIALPIPPLAEQRQIVARIEALFARTRRARADLERIAALSRRYFSAALAQAFQGTLTDTWRATSERTAVRHTIGNSEGPYELPEGWGWRPLPSLGELARGKSRHRPRNYPALYGGPYPFVQTGDIRAARGRLRKFHQTYSEAGLAQSRLWPRDTLCITIAANIAETAILDIEACFPDSVVGFRAIGGTCLPEYIEYFFRTAKDDLAAFAPATAQKNINLETLEAVLVPTPGLPEQSECVRLLLRSEAATHLLENEAARALALLDRLERGILARAFRGELVPQATADRVHKAGSVIEPITTVGHRRGRRAAA